jgi:hypothetical protein
MTTFKGMSEKQITKLHDQSKKLGALSVTYPHHADVMNITGELEDVLSREEGHQCIVYSSYAENTLIASEYAKTHFHYITKESMMNDIKAGKRIVFNNYR